MQAASYGIEYDCCLLIVALKVLTLWQVGGVTLHQHQDIGPGAVPLEDSVHRAFRDASQSSGELQIGHSGSLSSPDVQSPRWLSSCLFDIGLSHAVSWHWDRTLYHPEDMMSRFGCRYSDGSEPPATSATNKTIQDQTVSGRRYNTPLDLSGVPTVMTDFRKVSNVVSMQYLVPHPPQYLT